jgi:tetratricopeptide (TPR) repeat protein
MLHPVENVPAQKKCIIFALLLVIVFLAYSNTFDASWHLDDYANIAQDPRIHLNDLSPGSLWKTTCAFTDRPRDARPLARLSLAINWYFSRGDPFSYHVVNILSHVLTAFFLYLAGNLLLASPQLKGKYDRHRHFIVLLAVGFWAVNPIQTQAVTYIVQRMAGLAALFYVAGIYLYLKGRFAGASRRKIVFFVLCTISFIFGLASKENAAAFPMSLLLIEAAFFQDLSQKRVRRVLLGIFIGGMFFTFAAGVLVFFKGNPLKILNYDLRYFSPLQRVMTEPRILIYYLSQIFYPIPARLSIEHDIAVSTSLLHPWTTLPSIMIVSALVVGGVLGLKKYPLLGFAVLFFFLNHVIESSIIGLELVFEHRNYLPSLFLFFPVAAGFAKLLDYYRPRNRWLYRTLAGFILCLVVVLGAGTYVRNFAWSTEKTLWEDAVTKAPLSSRPWHNLALTHYERIGQPEKAMVLYRKALELEQKNDYHKSVVLGNMAANYYYRGHYNQALRYWKKSLEDNPGNPKTRFLLSLALIKLKKYREAAGHLDQLIARYPDKLEALNLRGVILLLENNYREALRYFKRCLQRNSWRPAIINAGAAFSLMGRNRRADMFFKMIKPGNPEDKIGMLWLAWNALKNGDPEAADGYLDRLMALNPVKDPKPWLASLLRDILYNDSIIVPQLDDAVFREQLMLKLEAKAGIVAQLN